MDSEFLQLRQLFVQGLEQRSSRIEEALVNEELNELYKEVHNLVGAAGGYQFHQLSHKARGVEQLLSQLKGETKVDAIQKDQLNHAVGSLLELIQQERQAY